MRDPRPVLTGCVFTGNRAENGGAVLERELTPQGMIGLPVDRAVRR